MVTQTRSNARSVPAKVIAKVMEKPQLWAILVGDFFFNRALKATKAEAQAVARKVAKQHPNTKVSLLVAEESFTYH